MERSQWLWSEITWIIAFGVFATLAVLFQSWFYSLRPGKDLLRKARLGVLLTAVSWDVFAMGYLLYYKPVWPGFYSYFILDRTGTLRGLFYISTAHPGVLTAIFGLALFARIVSIVAKRPECESKSSGSPSEA